MRHSSQKVFGRKTDSDVLTREQRSRCMAAIRATGNKTTELRLAKIFRRHGITGWRRGRKLTGSPDFVFPAKNLAVFVDGCFWHACPKHFQAPRQNAGYWSAKVQKNRSRDRDVTRQLARKGWQVMRVWEHSLRDEGRVAARFREAMLRGR